MRRIAISMTSAFLILLLTAVADAADVKLDVPDDVSFQQGIEYTNAGERISATGDSVGGHLALMLGLTGDVKYLDGKEGGNLEQSSRVSCVVDRLRAADVEAELLSMEGAGHGFKGEDAKRAHDAMLVFFDKHLKPR